MIDDDDIKENDAKDDDNEKETEESSAPASEKEAPKEKEKTTEDAAEVKDAVPGEAASDDAKKDDSEKVDEFEEGIGEEATENSEKDLEKHKTVTVQPVQFASFEDLDQVQGPQNQNLNILLDVKLQLSVELGKTDLPIKKVLELTKGSIVTLNKAAGEPVELYANGKLIAFGEVVVIEDNFGLRITHITDPVKRLNTINGNSPE